MSNWRRICFPVFFAIAGLLNGWVIALCWQWFVVPLGVAPIGVFQAVGLDLTVTYVTSQYREETRSKVEALAAGVIGCLNCLLLGWVLHLAMVAWP